MLLVKKYEPFYTQVWCAEDDEEIARGLFSHTEILVKSFTRPGKILLIKNKGKVTAPGFVDYESNVIVGTVEVNKDSHD